MGKFKFRGTIYRTENLAEEDKEMMKDDIEKAFPKIKPDQKKEALKHYKKELDD